MFNKQNFCHVASNNRNEKKAGIFVYKTTDDLATVSTSGYFNEKIVDINLHDLIIHEWHDPTDRTKVQKNVLCVTERTLDNVGTVVIKTKWEEDIEEDIEDLDDKIDALQEYVDQTFVRKDGTSVMTGPLLMRATDDFKCAIAPYWDGIGFFKLNDNNSVTLMASIENGDGLTPAIDNTYNLGTATKRWKDARIARVITATINNGYDIAVPVTNSADTLALKSQVDDAANSGEQLYTTGVWYAKMYAATVVPTGTEYDGRNYADFSQVDSDNNPIIVIYTGASGAWTETTRITPPADHVGYITVTSKIWDIAEQTDQQGGEVLWSYNQKTFTPYPKIISLLNQANTDLSNLTSTGQNISNWSSNVSNCITNIPQDIKLEFNNNTLTLKAGSKVYVPNGVNNFDVINIESDISRDFYGSSTVQVYLITDTLGLAGASNVVSGTTVPSSGSGLFYNLTTNIIKTYTNGTEGTQVYSFPLCVITMESNQITSIDQVFNGFGYIGSTVFALPGVKGLIPNGRNADGTLKNTAVTISSVQTVTNASNLTLNLWYVIRSNGAIENSLTDYWTYDTQKNLWVHDNAVFHACVFAESKATNGQISGFNSKPVFHAVDYSDTGFIAHQAMPSNRSIDLTLPANGGTITAPADGYLYLAKTSSASGQRVKFTNTSAANMAVSTWSSGAQNLEIIMPVSKNNVVAVYYSADGATNQFRFIYANGAQ